MAKGGRRGVRVHEGELAEGVACLVLCDGGVPSLLEVDLQQGDG